MTDVRSAFDDFFGSERSENVNYVNNESAENKAEFFHLRFNKPSGFAFEINEAADSFAKIADIIKVIDKLKFFVCHSKVDNNVN